MPVGSMQYFHAAAVLESVKDKFYINNPCKNALFNNWLISVFDHILHSICMTLV
jgi:hypothetical protein